MRWMPVRQFLRGGYKNITEPTVVSNHGHPMFTVMPAKPAVHTLGGVAGNRPPPPAPTSK